MIDDGRQKGHLASASHSLHTQMMTQRRPADGHLSVAADQWSVVSDLMLASPTGRLAGSSWYVHRTEDV